MLPRPSTAGSSQTTSKSGIYYSALGEPPALIDTEIRNFYSNIGADEMLFSEKDLEKSMDKIETINFHQVMHNLNSLYVSSILHSSIPYSSIPGGGCEWNQILVL